MGKIRVGLVPQLTEWGKKPGSMAVFITLEATEPERTRDPKMVHAVPGAAPFLTRLALNRRLSPGSPVRCRAGVTPCGTMGIGARGTS